ncbi:MAG: VCBS repeat-containing protein [Bacteroidota bacterium]
MFRLLASGFWLGAVFITLVSIGQPKQEGLRFPWAGGLNSCQYCEVDLNLDGLPDLIIFDRHGDRVLPFISDGTTGLNGYSFHPEFIDHLPDLHDWVQLLDYDGDGKKDIFTYSNGGVRVFRNVSDSVLKFKLITNQLKSFYYTGKVGILVTLVEYPGIADIDGDGDLDILTFSALGSFVEFHRNMSVEKYGTRDSLDFRLADPCWGDFKQSAGSDLITLNVTCPYKDSPLPENRCTKSQGSKHIGSSFLALDYNGDGNKDLILGDFDYPNLKLLVNGGTPDSAHIITQDTTFPSTGWPINLCSFPALSFIDLNHDGARDLVASPFNPALFSADNFNSNWYYENSGTDLHPGFQFKGSRFFQDQMIDVGSNSSPVLYDIDGDGLTDLLVGNYGYFDSSWNEQGSLKTRFISKIAWYRNDGSRFNPHFRLTTDDFGNLSALRLTGAFPTFADLDGDGDMDMITGNSDGSLIYFINVAGRGNPPVFAAPVMNFLGIDVGAFSATQLFDLDLDGLPDLIIGEKSGNINYYRNTGTTAVPHFTFVTDSLGKVNVTNYAISYDGYSTPHFFHDAVRGTLLLVGCEEGKVHLFTGIDHHPGSVFLQADSLIPLITGVENIKNPGWRTTVTSDTLTDSHDIDLIVGNFSGGLNYISRNLSPQVVTSLEDKKAPFTSPLHLMPNPASAYVSISFDRPNQVRINTLQIFTITGEVIFETQFTA